MLTYKDIQYSLDFIFAQICKEGLCNRPQWLNFVWEATKKIITNNWTQGRQTILANAFIGKGNRSCSKFFFSLEPTEILLNDCGLKYRSQTVRQQQSGCSVTDVSLYKNMQPAEKQSFKNDKQLLLRFFYLIISKVKQILKNNRNTEILLDHFGIIRVTQKTYTFEPFTFNDKGSNSTPNLHKYKRIQLYKKENSVASEKSQQSKLSNRLLDPVNQGRTSSNLKRRPYFHQVIVQNQPSNIRVCNDLLGAGIDPLTFDYGYSKLIDHPPELMIKQFKRQDHSQGRFPCVIDKFARTKGSQLTGIKVGNSIVVRIGSNYSPTVKNYYIDITTKSIQFVTPEVKIKLDNSKQRAIQPANQQEEYQSVTGKTNKYLQSRVQMRKQIYKRYCQYYHNIIPNDCVAPLKLDSIERIVSNVKPLVKKIGRKDGSPLINSLMSEVNRNYFMAYKKAILDYILKDKEEMVRTGINIIFKTIPDWGKPKHMRVTSQYPPVNLSQSKRVLELNHILYPQCLNKIYQQNQKLTNLQIFKKRKQGEYRPYNILYYIKRNVNQLNEAFTFLCDGWVKKVSSIIEQSINLKQQNYQKLKQFFNAIHIVMSNKLKELLYSTLTSILQQFSQFQGFPMGQAKNLLIINMTEQNQKICFIDDIQKVFRFELLDIVDKTIQVTRRIPRVESCLKLSGQIFVWGIDQKDTQLIQTKSRVKAIIEDNYLHVSQLRTKLSRLQEIFILKQEIIIWCKQQFKAQGLQAKLQKLDYYEKEIGKVSCYYKVSMVVIDCIQLKRKLTLHLKALRKLLFQSVQQKIRQKNATILTKINISIQMVCKGIATTTQFVELSKDIEQIKQKDMINVKFDIDTNFKDVMFLFTLDGFSANYQLMRSTYICRQSYEQLYSQLYKNQKRLSEERVQLERRLREKINIFQTQTLTWLKQINSKIDTFDMRKLYSEYLSVLSDYQAKVQANKQMQKQLNAQEEDLRWAATTFTHAVQLQNMVEPNYELWQLVAEYDGCIREWKYIQLSNFDIQGGQTRMNNIDNRITRLIVKLKNFAGLKIVYDLQNDVKQFLVQQVSIIKIFSNPGLKERHWNLFNKRLPLPGYDLKQLTYGRIKVLYEYQKNLKVLMSISNQAAKQFQIQNQKQEMYDYWARLNFSLQHAADQNIIFINPGFLDQQIQVIEHHLTKTVILKNSPFSKALVQLLTEWQNWLVNGRKILVGFRSSQQKFVVVRSIFKMDEISKLLPIESTEYDSIQNIWKSVIKKILEQPKITQFFKSQKMPQIIEQIGKKADFIRNSFNSYLNLKRLQFNRLYFLPEKNVLHMISLLATEQTQAAFQYVLWNCFIGINSAIRDQVSSFVLSSTCDSLQVACETLHIKKGKSKFFQELVLLEKNMRENIKRQIKQISYINQPYEQIWEIYTLTALFTTLQMNFANKIENGEKLSTILLYFKTLSATFIQKLKQTASQKIQNLLSKSLFLQWRCQQLIQCPNFNSNHLLKVNFNNDEVQVNMYNMNIQYQYEYLGQQAPVFIPISTDKLFWQIAFSLNRNTGVVCPKRNSIRELALFTGQYYVQINNPLHAQENNFESCIMGVISTNYWVHFIDEYFQFTMDSLALLTQTYQLKQQKINSRAKILSFKNSELSINSETGLFLTLPCQKYKELPKGLLTCTRQVSVVTPNLAQIKQYLMQIDKIEQLRNYLFLIKYEDSQINANKIWNQVRENKQFDSIKKIVKEKLWIYLNNQQQIQFSTLFEQNIDNKEETECKNWKGLQSLKSSEIRMGLEWSELIFVVGEQTCKSYLIQQIFKQKGIEQLFHENRGVNLSFIEEGLSQLSYVKYLQKYRERVLKQNIQIYIYIDTDINQRQLNAIQQFEHIHHLSPEKDVPLKIIIETHSLSVLDPTVLVNAAIVSISQQSLQQQPIFRWWVDKLNLIPEDKITLYELENSFQTLLNMILKMEKRPFNDSKSMLTKRFFSFFDIYLLHLNSKQVERMCQFDRQSYIFNSYIYCIYWSLGVCSLRSIQAEALKKHIREVYGQRLDAPGELDQIYLNEENEWVYWQTLKQEFVSQKQNIPLYQIWVPTANNTRLLTTIIKLVEHQHSITLCGSQSGRSSLLNQISSFQLSYNTFIIDCHRKTSSNHIISLAKGRILYGDFKKNLILVDDLHLPNTQVCDILRTFTERGYCLNGSFLGKLNQNIYKPSVMASWQGFDLEDHRCFWRFYGKTIPIQLQKFRQSEMEIIFRTYLNCLFLSNQVDSSFLKLQNTIVNFFTHTIKVFPALGLHHLRLLVESVCRMNLNKDEKQIIRHMLVQSQYILQNKLPTHEVTHFFRHMSYYYSKLLSIQLKNHIELKDIAENYIYDIRYNKECETKSTGQELKIWIQNVIAQKNGDFIISNYHLKVLQNLVWAIKGNNSHVILISNIKTGSRTLAKIAGWIMGLGILQLKNLGVQGLLEEVVKVLKTGGKVDECVSVLPYEVISNQPELLKLIHSLIFSPEFHQCFGQILMQQIIKSFNSQKKFLKKNVKKSELIKKIRQKFNSIFHFCLCLSPLTVSHLFKDFPKFQGLRLIQFQQWQIQSITAVSKKFISHENDYVLKAILKIEDELKNCWDVCGKAQNGSILCIFELYQKLLLYMEQNAKSQQQNTELWSRKIKINQQKIDNLQKQKSLFESQHLSYFEEQQKITEAINDATKDYQKLKQHYSRLQIRLNSAKTECANLKIIFEKQQSQVHRQYQDYFQQIKPDLISECKKWKDDPRLLQIATCYQYPMENIQQQISQLANQFQKDFFHRLVVLSCDGLGLLTSLIRKFQVKMQELWAQQQSLSLKFKQYEDIQSKYYDFGYKVREGEDRVSDLKDDQVSLRQREESVIKNYQDLKQKITQNESITSILLKFQHILKSKNQLKCSLPNNLTGISILATYMFIYLPLLPQQQVSSFINMLCVKLQQIKLTASPLELLAFLDPEQQFRLLNLYNADADEYLVQFGMNINETSTILVGQVNEVYEWLNRMFGFQNYIFMKDDDQIKEMLQKDQVILVDNPNSAVYQKLSNILLRPTTTKNNLKIIVIDDEDVTIHQNCRVYFIYKTIQAVPLPLLLHHYFAIKIFEHHQSKVKRVLEQKHKKEGIIKDREDIVNNYLKGCRQIGLMDEKMHTIIMKMKKQNVISQIIYKKIQEEGESKLQIQRKLMCFKAELNEVALFMQTYQSLTQQIIKIYCKYKENITFSSFLYISAYIIHLQPYKNLNLIPTAINQYISILFNKKEIKKLNQNAREQFQELTVNITQKGVNIITISDLTLGLQYLQYIHQQSKIGLMEIMPDQINASNIKQKQNYICLVSRQKNWKQIVAFLELSRQKIMNFKLIILVLDHLPIPPTISTVSLTVSLSNIIALVSDLLQRSYGVPNLSCPTFKTQITNYQLALDYKSYLKELRNDKEQAKIMKTFFGIQ